jgi:RimJ/RimL family protein N-acetyltransferase
MEFRAWAPTVDSPFAPGLGAYGKVLAAYHFLRVFRSREYGGIYIVRAGRIVHRSLVIPKYYRYPFMGSDDLQVGLTWTDPDFRGMRLATAALRKLVAAHFAPNRHIWYIVYADNKPSIAVSTRAGFREVGRIRQVAPLGFAPLSRYELIAR